MKSAGEFFLSGLRGAELLSNAFRIVFWIFFRVFQTFFRIDLKVFVLQTCRPNHLGPFRVCFRVRFGVLGGVGQGSFCKGKEYHYASDLKSQSASEIATNIASKSVEKKGRNRRGNRSDLQLQRFRILGTGKVPKKLCDKDCAELSGELSGAICLRTLVLLGNDPIAPWNSSENSLVLLVRFFGFMSPLGCTPRVGGPQSTDKKFVRARGPQNWNPEVFDQTLCSRNLRVEFALNNRELVKVEVFEKRVFEQTAPLKWRKWRGHFPWTTFW